MFFLIHLKTVSHSLRLYLIHIWLQRCLPLRRSFLMNVVNIVILFAFYWTSLRPVRDVHIDRIAHTMENLQKGIQNFFTKLQSIKQECVFPPVSVLWGFKSTLSCLGPRCCSFIISSFKISKRMVLYCNARGHNRKHLHLRFLHESDMRACVSLHLHEYIYPQ